MVGQSGDQEQRHVRFPEIDLRSQRFPRNPSRFRYDVSIVRRPLFRQRQPVNEGVLKSFERHFDRDALAGERRDMRPVGFEERPLRREDTHRRGGIDRNAGCRQIVLKKKLNDEPSHRVSDENRAFLHSLDCASEVLNDPGQRELAELRIGMPFAKGFNRLFATGPGGSQTTVTSFRKAGHPMLPAERGHVHPVNKDDWFCIHKKVPRNRSCSRRPALAQIEQRLGQPKRSPCDRSNGTPAFWKTSSVGLAFSHSSRYIPAN